MSLKAHEIAQQLAAAGQRATQALFTLAAADTRYCCFQPSALAINAGTLVTRRVESLPVSRRR